MRPGRLVGVCSQLYPEDLSIIHSIQINQTMLYRTLLKSQSTRSIIYRTMSTTTANKSSTSTFCNVKLQNTSLVQHKSFLNNQFTSTLPSGQEADTFEVTNPATGEVIGRVAEMGKRQVVEETIRGAKEAFKSWKETSARVSTLLMSRRWS